MKAQKLYDFREKWGFCTGSDLQEFLNKEAGGLSGDNEIDEEAATDFVMDELYSMEHNSPSMASYCDEARTEWSFRQNFEVYP